MSYADYLRAGRARGSDLMDELLLQFEARTASVEGPEASEGFTRALFSGDLAVTLPGDAGGDGDEG